MNNVGEKYLPIGTVVMLKGASKRLMITGFCSMATENENEMFDYSGCMYPEGFLSSDQTALFNHDQIAQIYHMGLVDDEEKQFKTSLNALVAQMNGGNTPVQQAAPVAAQPAVAPEQPVETPVPPIGPGLPGYVAPQEKTIAPVIPATGNYQFDENGVVVAEIQQQPIEPKAVNYQFDENGIVIGEE